MLRGFKSSALPLKLIPVLHWIYSPIFSLYPRELQLAMNIFIKKQTFTLVYWFYWQLFPRAMNIIIKKQKLENPGIDPGASRMQIERSTTWANPLVHWFYWPIFSLFPRELQLAMNIIIKKQEIGESGYRSRCFSNANRALYHLS